MVCEDFEHIFNYKLTERVELCATIFAKPNLAGLLWPGLLASAVLTLTIDSLLGTSVEDCFERIAIGEQIAVDAIYRNVTELTTKECEQICKQDKQCQTYDYGVGAKGNSTCNLSNINENQIKDEKPLSRNPDYDVYVRRFHCEQSPPTPLDQEVLENGPLHRPVIRPEEDKRPLADEFYEKPYEPDREFTKPYGRPSASDRPDGYDNLRPDDRPPSYGLHKPQETPYRPTPAAPEDRPPKYGVHTPQETPYKPRPDYRPDDRPPSYGLHRPQEIPYRPERPDIPDKPSYGPHRPQVIPYHEVDLYKPRPNPRPDYFPHQDNNYALKPEEPVYEYFIRPNRRPAYERPNQESKPYYSYNSQYASGYGNSNNDIHVEIYDPPRFRPNERPYHGYSQGSSGYGQNYGYQQSSHGSYGYQESSYAVRPQGEYDRNKFGQTIHGYGSTTYKPTSQKPSYRPSSDHNTYGQSSANGYGSSLNSASNYGNSQGSSDTAGNGYSTQSAGNSYGASESSSTYGSSQTPGGSYSSQSAGNAYGGSQSSSTYGSSSTTGGSYSSQSAGNAYGGSQSSSTYGSSLTTGGSYSSQSGGSAYESSLNSESAYGQNSGTAYGNTASGASGAVNSHNSYGYRPNGYENSLHRPSSYDKFEYNAYNQHSQSAGQTYNKYESNKPYNLPSYDQNSLFGSHLGYGTHHLYDMYGYKRPYEKPLYNQEKPHNRPKPSYETQQNNYDRPSNGYGNGNSNKPNGYGETGYIKPNPETAYSKPSYQAGYQSTKPDSVYGNKPSYNSKPDSYVDNERPKPAGYGEPIQDKPTNSYSGSIGTKPNQKPSYEPGYGDKPNTAYDDSYGSKPGPETAYRPDNLYPDKPGYSNQSLPAYNQDRPNEKPVYEFEERPDGPSYISRPDGNVITTRPVLITDNEEPGYGRNPDTRFSYKACFRRVLAGRRALRSHVRRVVDCERLEDCMRECAIERRFHCESFNYRLDPSFRGQGLCELMTKPIEAFDLNRDFADDKSYDFYELDRNSLEPNCPETLRGPGLLHSGYLSSKPKGQDRIDWYDAGYTGVSRYDERRKYTQHKRYEDQFFVPYQIGVVRGDDRENWGQYGGYYGNYDSYYKNRNDFKQSYNHWRISDFDRHDVKFTNKNFDYHNLGRQHSDEHHSYGDRHETDSPHHTDKYGLSDVNYHADKYYKSDRDYTEHKLSDFDYRTDKHSDFEHHADKNLDFDHRLDKHSDFDHHIGKEYWDYLSWKRGKWNTSEGSWSRWEDDTDSKEVWEGRSEEVAKDCSSRRRPGMSLSSGAVRRSLFASTVVECEAACFGEREFKCVSYSYRYSSPAGSDNCYLSERPYKGLDMSADVDSDVYAMPQHQGCHVVSTKPWVESECFWHVRSGAAVSGTAVKAALTVTGLGACEAECIRAHKFFCRGFSFRFEAPVGDDLQNCILTSSPPTSLETGRGLRPSSGHELYARGNYGRGCEPALYDDVHHRETQCYLQYDSSAKLRSSAVRGQARVRDAKACGEACTEAPFRCLSFSFTNTAPPRSDNCLLSEIRLFDLQRGVDYEPSEDNLLFAFDLFNGQCWRKVYGTHEVPTVEIPHPLVTTIEEYPGDKPVPPSSPDYITGPSGPTYLTGPDSKPVIEYGPKPSYQPSYLPVSGPSPSSGPDPIGPPIGLDYEPYRPFKPPSEPYRPHKPIDSYKPSYPPSGYFSSDVKPGYIPLPTRPDFLPGYRPDEKPTVKPVKPTGDEYTASWRHYTVSGFPCRRGTTCAQNHVAGHWACEPEGGEIGSWDYCCAPTHRCGYSEGFRKPWCYVGPEEDQWRPCSEKYYPYHQHNVPHPSLGNREAIRPRPDRPITEKDPDRSKPSSYLPEGDRRYWDDLYKNGPKAYYDRYGNPLPGYTRVPTENRPYIKFERNPPRGGSGQWVQVPQYDDEPQAAGLGVPRYWPVAYLHKSPPPNTTYFRFNETKTERKPRTTTLRPERDESGEFEGRSIEDNHRVEKQRNITRIDDLEYEASTTTTTTFKPESTTTEVSTTTEQHIVKQNNTYLDSKADNIRYEDYDYVKGLDGKLSDFTSIEVFNIEDAKSADKADVKTLEAEERQIEAIGRLLASKRAGKLTLDAQDLEPKNIAVDRDFMDINNRLPTRRGVVQRVSKEDLKKDVSRVLNDGSLEVSETTYVRPPRILSTTENIRKAIVNGKVFYDATIRDQREINATRKGKSLRIETAGVKKNVRRNVNPIRRAKRVYRKRYNPEEVRKRLLEREKSKNVTDNKS
ncbi:unnamed protein product [Leptosia nina]|uniref:Apple domain-containing protein n=1 Tax=Leptosia nina TaxID=320188 RepID=A0AAV1JJF5_9NEOP